LCLYSLDGERTRLQIIPLSLHFFAVFSNAGSGLFFLQHFNQNEYKIQNTSTLQILSEVEG
jgi:hypothetical protein